MHIAIIIQLYTWVVEKTSLPNFFARWHAVELINFRLVCHQPSKLLIDVTGLHEVLTYAVDTYLFKMLARQRNLSRVSEAWLDHSTIMHALKI